MVTSNKKRTNKSDYLITTMQGHLNNSLPEKFPTACGVVGAPEIPNDIIHVTTKATLYTQWLAPTIKFIKRISAEGGLLLGSINILNHPWIIEVVQQTKQASFILDKYVVPMATLNEYNNVHCTAIRSELPGNVLSHLTRRPTSKGVLNDYGLLDGVRFIGNEKVSHKRKENEDRPIHHNNFMIGAFLDKKKKRQYLPTHVWIGSPDLTANSESCHETINIYDDALDMAKIYFNIWAHYYSLSEDIVGLSSGINPQFWWNTTKQKYKGVPPCKNCGNTLLSTRWYTSQGKNRFGFWCPDCKATSSHKQ